MSRRSVSLLWSRSTQLRSTGGATSSNCSANRRTRASTEENRRVSRPLFFSAAGSSPRALARMSDNSLPVAPISRFWVWARIRSANSTTARCARSPNVTIRERSEISIIDLMRATADGSVLTAGRLAVSFLDLNLADGGSGGQLPEGMHVNKWVAVPGGPEFVCCYQGHDG